MKTKRTVAALLAAIVSISALCSCKGQSSAPSSTENEQGGITANDDKEEIMERFDELLSGMSAAVYAVYKGEEIYADGEGEAQPGTANSPDVAYGIASLTKQFTAAAVLQLYEEKKLDINDKLSKYFPDYAHGEEITVKQLLCQRSGIPDYEVNSYEGRIIITCEGSEKYALISAENSAEDNIDIIRGLFLSCGLLFEPGERFSYSDSNYGLLAAIIEKVSEESYHGYLRKHIFEPLGMNAAFIDDHDGMSAVTASGDLSEFGADYYSVKGAEFGCGDILASPKELYKWYKGLFGGKVISAESLKLMTENYSDTGELGYGFGLMIIEDKTPVYYHTGYIPSYYSTVIYLPEDDYFQAVLANRGYGEPHSAAFELAHEFCSVAGIKTIYL